MDFLLSLESVFKPVRQCVIGTDGDKLVFANPAAIAAFGDDLLEKTRMQTAVFTQTIPAGCMYCNGFDVKNGKRIPAAEQIGQ